jgi:hypothetical protein
MFFNEIPHVDPDVLNYTGTAGVDGELTITYHANMPPEFLIGTGTDIASTSTMSGSTSVRNVLFT